MEQRSAAGLNWEIGGLSDCFVSTVWDGNVKERACTPRATFFFVAVSTCSKKLSGKLLITS